MIFVPEQCRAGLAQPGRVVLEPAEGLGERPEHGLGCGVQRPQPLAAALAIGRALMGNPAFVLMDEPMEGLAPVIVDAVLDGLERLKKEGDTSLMLVEQHESVHLAGNAHAANL